MVSEIEKTVEKIEAAATEGGRLTISVNIPSAELFALADSWRRQREALKPLAERALARSSVEDYPDEEMVTVSTTCQNLRRARAVSEE